MGNTLKAALVQEVGNRTTQRIAFGALNEELRADASRVARVLGGLFVGRSVEAADETIVKTVDAVLLETNTGSQLGFGTEAEARKTTPTHGAGEWIWGEVFDDDRHRKIRNEYARRADELRRAEQTARETNGGELPVSDELAVLTEAAQTAKRQRALAALCVVAELNAAEQVGGISDAEASVSALIPTVRPEAAPLTAVA